MTAEQITEMDQAWREYFTEIPARHVKEIAQASDRWEALQKQCDHRLPDGTTACKGDMFMTRCELCGANDL